MSYDTFFTMKRLIERSRRPDEVLRWVTQNPAKISHNHYPVALQKIGQLLQATPPAHASSSETDGEASGVEGDARQILEHQDFRTLCNAIVSDCAKFDNFSIVNCLYAVAALGESLRDAQTHARYHPQRRHLPLSDPSQVCPATLRWCRFWRRSLRPG